MSKKVIRKWFTGDLTGGIAGNIQIIESVVLVDDETQEESRPREVKRNATSEELGAILGPELAALTEANAAVEAIVAQERHDHAAVLAARDGAHGAAMDAKNAELAEKNRWLAKLKGAPKL